MHRRNADGPAAFVAMCRRQVHALFTETKLVRQYPTLYDLLAHPESQVFVAWARTKLGKCFVNMCRSARVRNRRR